MDALEKKVWTIAEAKARLSEILRLASKEGPQRIGTKTPFIVLPEEEWVKLITQRKPLADWLVDNLPRGEPLQLPEREDPPRAVPFEDERDK